MLIHSAKELESYSTGEEDKIEQIIKSIKDRWAGLNPVLCPCCSCACATDKTVTERELCMALTLLSVKQPQTAVQPHGRPQLGPIACMQQRWAPMAVVPVKLLSESLLCRCAAVVPRWWWPAMPLGRWPCTSLKSMG